jgi:hypothetical protein
MDKTHYFKEEKLISEADNKLITLTTHRVRLNTGFKIVSIMLYQVSSVEIHYVTNFWYLIFAGISGIAGVAYYLSEAEATGLIVCGIVALLFLAIYRMTKKHTLSIKSSSNSIDISIKGMTHEHILGFVNDLEEAIAKYNVK